MGIRLEEQYGGEKRIIVDYWTRDRPKTEERIKSAKTEIERAREQITTAQLQIDSTVQELRSLGASWAVIGHLLGMTKAAAHKHYGRHELTSSSRQPD